ncbi:NADH-cytochrome b5 reductase [Trypanosoma theileri]|uniref:cytochrome-b5 reductase n=1 Tax=Trypanosoma theileri TaxID=67003 RepID=A0A1X0NTX4_9TRYP|nr:NADH-cytochrome b5 reductase [Trypanosoma theileri]ORC87933.1 NADH-cytochrome b5 reductase [Trypanosoma theileri]
MKTFIASAAAGLVTANYFRTQHSVEAQSMRKTAFSQEEFFVYKLQDVKSETHDTKLFTFALPNNNMPLNFEVPSCITLRFVDEKGNVVMRPYTPLNLQNDKGTFELLIKCYPHSKMGTHLHNMKVGDTIEAQGPWKTMDIKPSQYEHIGMLAGGTGITPLYQIARNFLADSSNTTKFSLVSCNKTRDDILLKNRLDLLSQKNHDKFTLFYMLTEAPILWFGYKGHITKSVIGETMPSPKSRGKAMVLVSGPPGFMKAVCGEKSGRSQGPLGGYLKEMGYSEDMVFKF